MGSVVLVRSLLGHLWHLTQKKDPFDYPLVWLKLLLLPPQKMENFPPKQVLPGMGGSTVINTEPLQPSFQNRKTLTLLKISFYAPNFLSSLFLAKE